MENSGSTLAALARWLACGVTSRTHPVLEFALRTYFHPLGIDADWLEAEPFSALESGHGECWLRGPRKRQMAGAPAADSGEAFAYLLETATNEAATFLHAAAGLILAGDPTSALYAHGEDAAFCAAVHARLRECRGE